MDMETLTAQVTHHDQLSTQQVLFIHKRCCIKTFKKENGRCVQPPATKKQLTLIVSLSIQLILESAL